MELADHVDVELESPSRVVSAHDVQLFDVAVEVVQHLGHRHLVRAFGAGFLGVVAELARQNADVGRVEVAIKHEIDFVAGELTLLEVGHQSDRREIVRC